MTLTFEILMTLILLSSLALAGCTNSQLKAPCNQYATFCGSKTKINQW